MISVVLDAGSETLVGGRLSDCECINSARLFMTDNERLKKLFLNVFTSAKPALESKFSSVGIFTQ